MALLALAGLAARAVGGLFAKGAAKKVITKVAANALPILRGTAATIGGVAATGAVGAAIDRYRGGAGASLPPGFAPTQGGSVPRPASLPTRIAQRLTPGGRTGREMTPYEGTELDKMGRPIAVYPETRDRLYAPPGYVIVYPWGQTGDALAMLKGCARSMGLWRGKPKPPVNGWDMRAITRAASAKKRVKKLAGKVGLSCATKGRGKC